MIATFLLGEMDSDRFGDKLKSALAANGVSEDVIRNPHTGDEEQSRVRRVILTAYRGWGQRESVFGGMPDDIWWMWAELDEEDLRDRVNTISWYFEETLGTRRPAEIAAMKRGQNLPTDNLQVPAMPPPPILLADPSLERLVILEGHSRIISYLVDPNAVAFPIPAIIGTSTRIAEWSEW